jgi:hypothetical protein
MATKNGLGDFAKRMYRRADQLDRSHNERLKFVAKIALRYLVTETPVDTTAAMSNWEVSFDGPVQRFFPLPPYVPGNANASALEAMRIGFAAIDAKQPGQSIWLSNSIDYIETLDAGSSTQKPMGWTAGVHIVIRRALELGTGNVRRTN